MTGTIGNRIANYVLESPLWQMGLGTVYQARDRAEGISAAVLLLDQKINQEISIQKHFVSAIREIDNLDHPSILKLPKAGEINGRFYATIPAPESINLGLKMQGWQQNHQTMQLEEALLLMAQIAEALACAHTQHIIHQALNPYSIIIKRQPQAAGFPLRAMVYDFGIGKLHHALLEIPPAWRHLLRSYASPEQLSGQRIDYRTDLFAIGVILCQLLTAALPFSQTKGASLRQISFDKTAPMPRDVQKELPPVVAAIILKALHKNLEQRYQSGLEMAAALRNAALQLANTPSTTGHEPGICLRTQLPAVTIDRLFIFSQNETARIVPLDKRVIIIGRSRTSDIRLAAEGISRHHVRLEQTNSGWNIVDLKSTNGSTIAAEPLAPDIPHYWAKNHALSLGPYVLKWR